MWYAPRRSLPRSLPKKLLNPVYKLHNSLNCINTKMSSNVTATVDMRTISSRPRERAKVDHTYRDFSCYLLEGGELIRKKKSGNNFPAKLHEMLSEPQFLHIIAWMPHGRAFRVLNKELLTTTSIPSYFSQTKFESFTRQLSGWGFKRLCRSGPDKGCYYNESFLRDLPKLTWLMSRVATNKGKLKPNPNKEPNFYKISRLHPQLPPPASTRLNSSPHTTTAMILGPGQNSIAAATRQTEAASASATIFPAQLVQHSQTFDMSNISQLNTAHEYVAENLTAAMNIPSTSMSRSSNDATQDSTTTKLAPMMTLHPGEYLNPMAATQSESAASSTASASILAASTVMDSQVSTGLQHRTTIQSHRFSNADISSASTPTDIPGHNPHIQDCYSMQDRIESRHYQQESLVPPSSYYDHAQMSLQGEELDGFHDDMNAFIDNFQF